MNMSKVFPGLQYGGSLMLFFDVGVEGVEVKFQSGTPDVTDQPNSLFNGVKEISLKPVYWFYAYQFAMFRCVSCYDFQVPHNCVPMALLFSPRICLSPPDAGIDRSAQNGCVKLNHKIDHSTQIAHAFLLAGGVASQVAFGIDGCRNGAASKSMPGQLSLYKCGADVTGVFDE